MYKNQFGGFPEDLFRFLEELAMNNNREWFNANKLRYQTSVATPVSDFISAMGGRLARISPHFNADPRPSVGSMFRIYRDTRFSHDKRPYKENVGCHFRHVAGKGAHSPGFYLHLQPGKVYAGAGIWKPLGPELNKIRSSIVEQPDGWDKSINNKRFIKRFGEVEGESLKRPPSGYDANHPNIEDLKRKSFFVKQNIDTALALTPEFIDEIVLVYTDSVPLMKFISRALGLPF